MKETPVKTYEDGLRRAIDICIAQAKAPGFSCAHAIQSELDDPFATIRVKWHVSPTLPTIHHLREATTQQSTDCSLMVDDTVQIIFDLQPCKFFPGILKGTLCVVKSMTKSRDVFGNKSILYEIRSLDGFNLIRTVDRNVLSFVSRKQSVQGT